MCKRLIVLFSFATTALFSGNFWFETTHADFADGVYENTIYASHRNGGAVEFVPRYDLNNDGYIDIVTCDIGGPYVTIHWGSAQGYTSGNQTAFPASGAGNCDISDVNTDGFSDFIVSHANSVSRLSIYWGSSTGPSPNNVFSIPNSPSVPNEVAYTADLNKDGYLDIIIGAYYSLSTGSIFWGSINGYSSSNRTDLPTAFGAHNTEVADLNKDGWYEIIYVNNNSAVNYIYWGSINGYTSNNMTSLAAPTSTPHGASVADLNADGFLDLVFTSVYGTQSYIYYGSSNGFTTYQTLNAGSTYGGSAVCKFNEDPYLDIVFFRGWPTALKPIIYWGSINGYSNSNSTEIGNPANGSGGYVADFNFDGSVDIFVNSRSSSSPIFWGPCFQTATNIAVSHDHHALFREIGNIYNREYYEDYVSSVFDAGTSTDWGTVEWIAYEPEGALITVYVRTGNSPSPDQTWSDWETVNNGGSIPTALNSRYIQYKTCLSYTNPCYLPLLEEIKISYGSAMPIQADIEIKPEVININSHGKFTAFITLPFGYDIFDIDGSTIICEGAPAVFGHATPPKYNAKFYTQDLVGVLPGPAVIFSVTGELFDGTIFIGYDTVHVIGHENTFLSITPNPFNRQTLITMSTPAMNDISARVYSVNGALVRDFGTIKISNGAANIIWDRKDDRGRMMPDGVYLIKIEDNTASMTKKIIILD